MKTRKTVSLDRGRTEWENEKRLFALKLENSSIAWRMQPTLSVYRVGFISRQIKAGKPIKGFYYYYAGEMLPDEYRQKIRNQKKKPNYKSRPVICLETGERFESISLVSRMLGISKSNVFHAMKNGSAVHGIHFYYGDELKPDDSFFKPKRRRKVRCTETGVVYESIKDAAERTKISPNGIGSAASGMAGGYHWEYADD